MAQIFFLLDPAAEVAGLDISEVNNRTDTMQGVTPQDFHLSGKFILFHTISFLDMYLFADNPVLAGEPVADMQEMVILQYHIP